MPFNTLFHFRHALLALTLSLSAAPALAQPASALGNWRDYEKAGYVAMNGMTMPLLHYARTGQMFDALQLAVDAESELPDELRRDFSRLHTSEAMAFPDEFKRQEVKTRLEAFMKGKAEVLKESGGYLYLAKGQLKDYDFARKGFPLKLELPDPVLKSKERLSCKGVHHLVDGQTQGKTCISAANLGTEPTLQFLPVDDLQLAKQLRQKESVNGLQYVVVAHVDGKYRVFQKARPTVRVSLIGMATVLGIQPTHATELLLIDQRSGDILAKLGAKNGAQAQGNQGAPIGRSP